MTGRCARDQSLAFKGQSAHGYWHVNILLSIQSDFPQRPKRPPFRGRNSALLGVLVPCSMFFVHGTLVNGSWAVSPQVALVSEKSRFVSKLSCLTRAKGGNSSLSHSHPSDGGARGYWIPPEFLKGTSLHTAFGWWHLTT
jgi:hypothetical protein